MKSLFSASCPAFRTIVLCAFFILLFTHKANSQQAGNINNNIPSSPNSNSLLATSTNSVSLYSGKINHYSKIEDITLAKLKISLGLRYVTSGIKVQDIAGFVGLGWAFDGGGAITRNVVSLPDEQANGYCGVNNIGANNYATLNKSFFEKTTKEEWDSEPDKFNFSFMGMSGVFMLDQNGNPVFQSSYGLKVIYSPFNRTNGRNAGGAEEWRLMDFKGNTYIFGATGSIETSNTVVHRPPALGDKSYAYISAWYIKKIITADNQQIVFDYISGQSISFTNYINAYLSPGTLISGPCTNAQFATSFWNENSNVSVNAPLYLSSISTSSIQIGFNYGLNRLDLVGGKAMTEINITSNGSLRSKYKLDYSYFLSTTGDQRLRLDGVRKLPVGSGVSLPLYKFNYNTTVNLPARNSIQTDYFGFYNSNPGTSNIEGYQGGSKTPNSTRTAANILTSVVNLYGSETYFEYEQNSYREISGSNIVTKLTGGLRVKKIFCVANNKEVSSEIYEYSDPGDGHSSGQLYAPNIAYDLPMKVTQIFSGFACILTGGPRYSEPLAETNDLFGVSIGYSHVTVKKSDNSYVRYSFNNFSDYPDLSDTRNYTKTTNNANLTTYTDGSSYFFPRHFAKTSYAFARGGIKVEEYYSNTNTIVKKRTYNYTISDPINEVIGIKSYTYDYANGEIINYLVNICHFSTRDLLLSSTVEENIFSNGSTSTTESFTYTKYLGNHFLKTKSKTMSDGSTAKTTLRYIFDVLFNNASGTINSTLPYNYLKKNNIISEAAEVISTRIKNGIETVTSVNLTKFEGTETGLVKPKYIYKLNASSPVLFSDYVPFKVMSSFPYGESTFVDSHLERYLEFNSYDAYGNVKASSNSFSIDYVGRKTFVWGYDGSSMIGEVKNANYSEVYLEDFEENNTANVITGVAHTGTRFYSGSSLNINWTVPDDRLYVISYWYKIGNIWKFSGRQSYVGPSKTLSGGSGYDNIRIHPADAEMSTCTYIQTVGMTSAIDAKGITTYYEYDDYQRLKNVKDGSKNILKTYDYNYTFPLIGNQPQSQAFTKACSAGYNGSTVIYTVPINSYYATTQAEANELAIANIAANGQSYANANGTCTSAPISPFIKLEIKSSYVGSDNHYYRVYSFKAFSDAALTVPKTLTSNYSVAYVERVTTTFTNGNPSTTVFNNRTITILSGNNFRDLTVDVNTCGTTPPESIAATSLSNDESLATSIANSEAAQSTVVEQKDVPPNVNLIPPGGPTSCNATTIYLPILD